MKLKKFIKYTQSLLPHEIELLNQLNQFQDEDRIDIFERIYNNTLNLNENKDFDEGINKRKYSHLMNWMQSKLNSYCTDNYYKRLNYYDNRIKTDTISSEEETELLSLIKHYSSHHYHFIRFYEVVKNYLVFLLVRVRLNDYELINQFIHQYHDDYIRCKEVSNRMTQSTADIVADYHTNKTSINSTKWLNWLRRLYADKSLDGHNRYQALILLSYISLTENSLLEEVLSYYKDLEDYLIDGTYYSRKLLLNYYGNKQLILMKLHKYDFALYYGKLSISDQGHDYVMYLSNYCFNLLKLGEPKKALVLLKEALPFARQMSNKFNRTLYISSLMKCYIDNGQYNNAKQFAENQLALHEKDIIEHNWNKFFRTYLESLLHLREYSKVKRIIKRYNLIEKESTSFKNYIAFPYFKWFLALVNFKEGNISQFKFSSSIKREVESLSNTYNIKPSGKILALIEDAVVKLV